MNGFHLADEFMFSVMLCQIAECNAPSRVHLVDGDVQSINFCQCVTLLGKISNQANWDIVLHPLAIGLSYGAVEQYPRLTVAACLFFFNQPR